MRAALLAALLIAPQAWANNLGHVVSDGTYSWYIGDKGASDNGVTKFVAYDENPRADKTAGGYSNDAIATPINPPTPPGDTVANNNHLSISHGSPVGFGGYAETDSNNASVTGNALHISGSPTSAYGGSALSKAGTASASNNAVFMYYGGSVPDYTYGGAASTTSGASASASENAVHATSASIGNSASVSGGYATTDSGAASATGNTVTINNGSFGSISVYGGYAETVSGTASVTDNTVVLGSSLGADTLANVVLYGGIARVIASGSGTATVSDNTLEVQGKNLSVRGFYNFASINFSLPNDFSTSDTALITRNTAGLMDVAITVSGDMAQPLAPGDTLTLISDVSATGTPKSSTIAGVQGYNFRLDTSSGALIATVAKPYDVLPASTSSGGTLNCPATTAQHGKTLTITCTATPNTSDGYEFASLTLTDSTGNSATCKATTCSLANVQGDVSVSATFTKAPTPPDPTPTPTPVPYYYSDDSSPTMGELGLLLSGLALAGAAAPALRRRERKERKQG
ncbi:MAG: hypothetical protein IJR28_01675 [Ottowia sp.]|nr:hypothetical protein [Ottowia sp.]